MPTSAFDIVLLLLLTWANPVTRQSPAVSAMDVILVVVPAIGRETLEPEPVMHSPTVPAVALDAFVTPGSETGVVRPLKPVMFEFAPEVAIAELHPNPVPFVHWRACAAPLQPVTATAVGIALAFVALAITELAAIAAKPPTGTRPQVGGVVGPVDTGAIPAAEPAGLNSDTGTVVAPNAKVESARSAHAMSRFMLFPVRNHGVIADG
jgi:hypothetical protein